MNGTHVRTAFFSFFFLTLTFASELPYRRPVLLFTFIDLREHAIFALHNLLEGNQKNQAVVEAIGPSDSRNRHDDLRDR
jgi:hypothetical protein